MTGISEDRGLSHVLRYADSVGIALLRNCVEEAETFAVNW